MTEVAQKQLDNAHKPIPFLFNWGIPILVLVSVNIVQGFWPVSIVLWMIIGSFTWMGIGCVINAARCGRLHCYFSGPIFLIGALATFLVGFEFADLGSISVSLISNVTIVLALSTFILEWVWGAYGSKRSPDPLN